MSNSFEKGFKQVPIGMARIVKDELMNALKIKTNNSWSNRLKGKSEPRVSEARAIEEIFAKHGITDVWG